MATAKHAHDSHMTRPHKPLIPARVVMTTFITFVVMTLVFFHYDAYSNGLTTSHVNVGNMLVTLFGPVAIALLTAPVLGVVKHSTFMDQFKPMLCLTAFAGILYILYLLATGQSFAL